MAEQDKIVHGNFRIKLLPKIKIFLWKKKNEDIDEGYVLIERVDRAFVSRCFSLLRDRASKISPVQGRNGIMRSVRGRNTRCSYSDVGETRMTTTWDRPCARSRGPHCSPRMAARFARSGSCDHRKCLIFPPGLFNRSTTTGGIIHA